MAIGARLVVALLSVGSACAAVPGPGDTSSDADDTPEHDEGADEDADADVDQDDARPGDADPADAEADDAGPDSPVDPSEPGPYAWTVVDAQVVRGSRTTPVSALIPDSSGAPAMPMLLFLPGFQMQTAWYLPLLERIATHGFVVVRADPPASLMDNNHPELALDAEAVLDWALDPEGPVAAHVDAARIAAAGHSNGGKICAMLAFADPRVSALLGLDPINGRGPFGFNEEQPDIVPDRISPLEVPIGLMGETTDATGRLGGQACAPAELSFFTFYDAATSAPWVAAWEIEGADHIDFVLDTEECGLPCRLCREGGADDAAVRETIQTLAVAFLRRHLRGEVEQEAWLLGEHLPGGVVLQHRP